MVGSLTLRPSAGPFRPVQRLDRSHLIPRENVLADYGNAHYAATPVEGDAGGGVSVGVPGKDRNFHVAVVVDQAVGLGGEERVGGTRRDHDADGLRERAHWREADELADLEDELSIAGGGRDPADIEQTRSGTTLAVLREG